MDHKSKVLRRTLATANRSRCSIHCWL